MPDTKKTMPHFENGQVLHAEQLNELVGIMEQMDSSIQELQKQIYKPTVKLVVNEEDNGIDIIYNPEVKE